MATDSLAEELNRTYGTVQQPGPTPAPAVGPALNTQGWFGRAKDYLANTDWGNLAEAMYRVNPITGGALILKDLFTEGAPTAIANQRLMAGQLSRFPTDVAAGVTGLYPGVAAIRSAATGEPMSGFAQSMLGATEAIDEFGRSYAEPIAGVSLKGDDAGSLLRGTPPQMAGQWARLMSQAIVPLPTKVTAPIMAGAAAIKEGLGVLGPAAAVAAKTIEAITPLAVSSAPSTKNMLINLGAQGTIGPAAEAVMQSLMPAQEAKNTQDEADKVIQQGTAQATAGKDLALGEKPAIPATPQMAGYITGDTGTDIGITAAITLAALFAARKNETVRRVTDGITRAAFDRESLTGYSRTKPEDATIQGLTTKLTQQYSNRSASMPDTLRETMRVHGFSKNRIDDMIGQYKEDLASRSGAGLSTKERVFYDTGEFMDTNIKSKPMNDLAVEFGAATPAQQKLAAEVLWGRNELDVRQRMVQKQFSGGQSPLLNAPIGSAQADAALLRMGQWAGQSPAGGGIFQRKYAYNLYNIPSHQLHSLVSQGMADPVVRNLVRGYRDIVDKAADYMVKEKRFTGPQGVKFKAENPNYVPPRLDNNVSFFNPRDPTANYNPRHKIDIPKALETFEQLGNPFHNLPKYMDEVFRSTEGSKGKRDFMLTMMKAQKAGNAYAQKIIGRDLNGLPAGEAAHRFVTWRDLDGNKRYTEIHDAVVRDALKGVTSPTALQLAHGTASAMTRFYESGAVGHWSIAAGTVFAPKSALYAATIGTALSRPKGVAIGAIDRISQNLTGIGIRGVDGLTTMPIHMAIRSATNIGTVLVERGARILHNSVLDNKGILSLVDPATRQAAADAMHSWYRKTAMYDMQRQGLMSPGSFMSVDPSLKYSDPTRALTRGTGITVGGVHVPGSKIVGETGSFVNDILHAISSSPAMAIMDVNKNVPKWKVSSAIRNLSGDPGASGAYRNAPNIAKAVQATPWGNIYVQSMTRLFSSFKNDPGGTLAGITAGIGMPAMMATIWNNDAGPEYSRYQYLERTPDKQASSIYIAIPGRNPNDGIEIDIDPLMRPFKYIAEGLTGLATGAFTGEMFKPGNEEQRLAFKEMIHHRMSPDPLNVFKSGTLVNSLAEQSLIPPVPGFVQAIAAATGVQLRSYVDARATHARPTQGFASGTEPGVSVSMGMAEDIMRGIGASFGGAVVDFIRGIVRDTNPRAAEFGNVTKPLIGGESSALGTQVKEWKQKISDSTAELGSGPLFNTFRAIVPSQEAASQAVKVKIDNIKTIAEQMQQTTNRAGIRLDLGNKKIGIQERIGAHPAQPGQVEGEVAQATQELYKMLQPTLQQIKVHYQQSESIKASNQFTPAMKRALREEEGYKIIDLNRRMLQDVQRAERVLSQQYGTKIDFSNIKLQGGQ